MMKQLALFGDAQPRRFMDVVNVASVPQRSPFRYPGGKTWLVPRIRQWLRAMDIRPHELIEPFAGGGIVSLTVAFERLADHVTMVELDPNVAAVWKTVICGNAERLADRILRFDLTAEALSNLLSPSDLSIEDLAFRTIVRNRVNRGGILAPGAGIVKHGEDGKGLRSRWYPATLHDRITSINTIRERITFVEGDGLEIMRANAHRDDTVFFIDPPYTAAGKRAGSRLYACNELDHEDLFAIAATVRGHVLMTYDDAAGVRELADRFGLTYRLVAMKSTHHAKMNELLIGRDLGWLD